jgi:hypothetical protein
MTDEKNRAVAREYYCKASFKCNATHNNSIRSAPIIIIIIITEWRPPPLHNHKFPDSELDMSSILLPYLFPQFKDQYGV